MAREIARSGSCWRRLQEFDALDLEKDPSGESLEPAALLLDSLQATIGIDVLSVARSTRSRVMLSIETPIASRAAAKTPPSA